MDQAETFTEPFLGSSKDEVSELIRDDYHTTALESIDIKRSVSNLKDELWQFRLGLLWLGLEQLNVTHVVFSWILFLVFTFISPFCSVFLVVCHSCDNSEKHPFKELVQISESVLSVVGFLCLSAFLRTYGLRKMLFLDQIGKESAEVQHGYQKQLQDAFRLLVKVLLPCFIVELIHKIMWFAHASVNIPGISNHLVKNVIMCFLMMISWLYRAAVFLLVCVLFRLLCSLQILRFKGYFKLLESNPRCSLILKEHMRIRNQLIIISHRFRIFLLSSLITITLSQIASLFIITARSGALSFPEVGDLAVSSATQLIGFVLCLHGAAKITHTADRIVKFITRWHAVVSCIDLSSSSNNNIQALPILHVESHEDLESASASCTSITSIAGGAAGIKSPPRSYFKRQAL
ncbi:hypothetical protein KI387_015863, partial [Taxus chinensis]